MAVLRWEGKPRQGGPGATRWPVVQASPLRTNYMTTLWLDLRHCTIDSDDAAPRRQVEPDPPHLLLPQIRQASDIRATPPTSRGHPALRWTYPLFSTVPARPAFGFSGLAARPWKTGPALLSAGIDRERLSLSQAPAGRAIGGDSTRGNHTMPRNASKTMVLLLATLQIG